MAGTRVKACTIFCVLVFCLVSVGAQRRRPPGPPRQSPGQAPPNYGQGGNYTGFGLRFNFYAQSCPRAEGIIQNAVRNAVNRDRSIIAGIIRLFFHDCFVRGCDASVLLDGPDVEKLGAPNANSLRGFEVIDEAKAAIEAVCPLTVSCADIIAYAARDSLVQGGARVPFGLWLGGRKDGDTSISAETLTELPAPFLNYAELVASFARKGLSEYEMVVLSAAHTVGIAHCGIILARLYNFQGTGQADPAIDPTYLPTLRSLCPATAPGNIINMDLTTPNGFDTNYVKDVLRGRGLFETDNALRTNANGVRTLNAINNEAVFGPAFTLAMLHMGAIEVKTGTAGKIRRVCNTNAGAV